MICVYTVHLCSIHCSAPLVGCELHIVAVYLQWQWSHKSNLIYSGTVGLGQNTLDLWYLMTFYSFVLLFLISALDDLQHLIKTHPELSDNRTIKKTKTARLQQESSYLTFLGAGWLQVSVEDLLDHVRKQAHYYNDDDGEPGRAAGQQLHEHKVHVLGVKEGPAGRRPNKVDMLMWWNANETSYYFLKQHFGLKIELHIGNMELGSQQMNLCKFLRPCEKQSPWVLLWPQPCRWIKSHDWFQKAALVKFEPRLLWWTQVLLCWSQVPPVHKQSFEKRRVFSIQIKQITCFQMPFSYSLYERKKQTHYLIHFHCAPSSLHVLLGKMLRVQRRNAFVIPWRNKIYKPVRPQITLMAWYSISVATGSLRADKTG